MTLDTLVLVIAFVAISLRLVIPGSDLHIAKVDHELAREDCRSHNFHRPEAERGTRAS